MTVPAGLVSTLIFTKTVLAQTLDTYYKYVSALFKGDRADNIASNASTVAADASTNAFTPTVVGSIRNDAFSPFLGNGYYSNNFDGATTSISAASNAGFGFTGQFTVEGWFYWKVTPTVQGTLIGNGTAGTFGLENTVAGGPLVVVNYGAANITPSSTFVPTASAWHHIAVTRNAANLVTLWIDGVANTSATYAGAFTASAFIVGGTTNFADVFVSNLRVVNGSAVYSTAFTPPTTPLTTISGTVLLTCQSSRFIDTSSNALAITRTGVPTVSQFLPFSAPAVAVNAGSMAIPTSSALQYATSSAFAFGTGDFTVEYWYYPTSVTSLGGNIVVDFRNSGATGNFVDSIGNNTAGDIAVIVNGTTNSSATNVVFAGAWNHIAWARTGTTLNVFVNGALVKTATASFSQAATTLTVGNQYTLPTTGILAYISNVRIQSGLAQYTTAFTPPSAPLSTTANTVLLTAQGTAPVTNRAIIDSSGANYPITVTGNVGQGTFSPFNSNGYSSYFNATSLVTYPANTGFAFNAAFTIEGWFNWQVTPTSSSATPASANTIFGTYTTGGFTLYMASGQGLTAGAFGSAGKFTGTFTPTPGAWYHIAVTRDASNLLTLWVNGVATNSVTDATAYTSSSAFSIGTTLSSTAALMYVSNFRVVNGFSLYTSTFAPNSTTLLQAVAGTTLLTCQGPNTFLDYGPNNLLPTVSAASSQPLSPYRLLPVTTSSALFAGSGSYLTSAGSSDQSLAAGPYTVECFFNTVAVPTSGTVQSLVDAATTGGIGLQLTSTGFQTVQAATGSTGTALTASQLSYTFAPNVWYHIAIVRTSTVGNGTAAYVNGTLVGRYQDATSYTATAVRLGAAANGAANYTGYISSARITNTSVYSSNFTTPTSPLTQVTGSQFLALNNNNLLQQVTLAGLTTTGSIRLATVTPFAPSVPPGTGYTTANVGGSLYFGGTGNYVSTTVNARTAPTGTNFTIEMWVYYSSVGTSVIFTNRSTTTSSDGIQISTGAAAVLVKVGNTSIIGTSAGVFYPRTWNHLVVARAGTLTSLYINGVLQGTPTSTASTITNTTMRVGADESGLNPLTGYVAGLRVTYGSSTALSNVNDGTYYAANFVPRQLPWTPIPSTTLLLNGTNAAVFDSVEVSNAQTFGEAIITTKQSKFGGTSMYFGGTAADYVSIPDAPTNQLRLEDFTIEGWFYKASNAGATTVLLGKGSTTTGWAVYISTSNTLSFADAAAVYLGTTAISLNTWYHFALVRVGTAYRLYLNGNLEASATITDDYVQTTPLFLGCDRTAGVNPFNGYIDDLRITKGYARYTAAFTPPSAGFFTA